MNKKSLEIVQEKMFKVIDNTKIDPIDKLELLINLSHFLSPEKYDDNIKTLQKAKKHI